MSDGLEFFDVSLWCALSFCARGGDQCRPSDGQLAEMLSVSVPTVQRGLRRLEGASFIDRHYDGEERLITLRPEGDGQAVAYRLRVIAG